MNLKQWMITVTAAALCLTAQADELFKADFSGGTPGTEVALSWTIGDPMFTVHENVQYYGGLVNIWGGLVGTTNWIWSADGESIYNADLFVVSHGGSTTRIDVKLDKATAGKQYFVSNLVVTVAGTVTNDIHFGFRYKTDGDDKPGLNTVIPDGSSGTFTLDLTSLGLLATDTKTPWDAGTSFVEFFEPDGENVDWIAVDSITINGRVEDLVLAETNTLWEFNTPGDTEGWAQSGLNSDVTGLDARAAVSGTEGVLSSTAIAGDDPQLARIGLLIPPSTNAWSRAVIRARQLDTNGVPLAWDSTGCGFEINSVSLDEVGNGGWYVQNDSNGWMTAALNILSFSTNELSGLKFEPVGGTDATNKNFEIDYIELQTSPTVEAGYITNQLIYSWEFNTPGDAEGFFANEGFSNVTAAVDIDGVEGVLTSDDQWAADPRLWFNAYPLTKPSGGWEKVEMRMRQLDGNPGDPGVTSIPWVSDGTIIVFGSAVKNFSDTVEGVTVTAEADNWNLVTVDVSDVGSSPSFVALDPLGPFDDMNFEVDYIRVYGATDSFDMWAFNRMLDGTDADTTADPDGDGADNFTEFAYDGDPNVAADLPLMRIESELINGGDDMVITHYIRNHAQVDYGFKSTTDLTSGTWGPRTDHTELGSSRWYNSVMNVVSNQLPLTETSEFIRVVPAYDE